MDKKNEGVIKIKIGLIDVDRLSIKNKNNFPNLALMKLSAYHKLKCDEVEFVNQFMQYNKIYTSKIFDFSLDYDFNVNCKNIVHSGIGYGDDIDHKLQYEIEHIFPDYSLYGIKNESYGFLTRGCPCNCDFCNVTNHQGNKSIKVADLNEFWNGHKKICLLDPNITACSDKKELFEQLIQSKSKIDFTQGLRVQMLTDEDCFQINKMKIDMLHFAWDQYEFKTYESLKCVRKKLNLSERKLRVYVLVNFNTTHEQDLERIYKLRELGYDPYVMVFDKTKLPKGHITKKLQRWVNNKFIWRSCLNFKYYGGDLNA